MSDTPNLIKIPEDTQPCPAAASPPAPDSFFNLTLVSFQVENTVFRVPKYGFDIPGTIFEAMFTLPSPENGEGSSNDNPIKLDGIQAEYFRAFLRVMYPFTEQPPVTEFDDWVGVLALSTLWEFHKLRKRAITALSGQINNKNVVQRIHLARKYDVADWIRDSYVELVQKDTLKLVELSEASSPLDWPTIAKIFYLRENTRSNATVNSIFYHSCGRTHGRDMCPYGYAMGHTDRLQLDLTTVKEAVDNMFLEELKHAKEAGADQTKK